MASQLEVPVARRTVRADAPGAAAALRPLAIVLLALVAPVLVLGGPPPATTEDVLIAFVTVYAGTRLAMVVTGEIRILQLFFWFYVYVFLGVAAAVQSASGDWALSTDVSPGMSITASLTTLTAVAAYDLGGLAARRSAGPAEAPWRVLAPRRLALATPAAIAVCLAMMALLGGPGVLLTSRADRSGTLNSVSSDSSLAAVKAALLVVPVFVCGYLLFRAIRAGVVRRGRLLVLPVAALALFAANPVSSARYTFATVWCGLALGWLWPLTRRQFAAFGVLLLVALFVLFPALNQFRTESRASSSGGAVAGQLMTGDYDSFQQVANTVDYVDTNGHTFGAQATGALLFFVPRSVWPGKAQDTGRTVGEFQGYGFTNLSAPLTAESYIDGGFAGVAVVFAVVGHGTRRLERASRHHGALTFSGLLVPFLAVYQVILLRGSLLQAMGGIVAMVGMLWLCTRPNPDRV